MSKSKQVARDGSWILFWLVGNLEFPAGADRIGGGYGNSCDAVVEVQNPAPVGCGAGVPQLDVLCHVRGLFAGIQHLEYSTQLIGPVGIRSQSSGPGPFHAPGI